VPFNPLSSHRFNSGGGNEVNTDLNLGRTAGLWMAFEAISCGLQLEPNRGDWDWDTLGDVRESLTSVWHILEWLPFKRPTYKETPTTYRCVLTILTRDVLIIF